MSAPGQPPPEGKDSLPVEPPERHEVDLWWPDMSQSRLILADYVSQHEVPPSEGTELPEDPDPGDEG